MTLSDLPSHAVAIYFDGSNEIAIKLGTQAGPAHTVKLPLDAATWPRILALLHARLSNSTAKLGTRAAPTQHNLARTLQKLTLRATTAPPETLDALGL